MAYSIVHYGVNIPHLYDVYFEGDIIQTIVTKQPGMVRDWIIQTQNTHRDGINRLLVGLGVEWRRRTYSVHENPVAVLVFCVNRRCLIFQLLQGGIIPYELTRFLANPVYAFVGVGIGDDVNKLTHDYALEVARFVDLRDLASIRSNDISLRSAGLKDLARVFLDVEIVTRPRSVVMNQWDRVSLSNEQVMYACIDAFASFKIGMVLDTSY